MNTQVLEHPQASWIEVPEEQDQEDIQMILLRPVMDEIARVERMLRDKDRELTTLMADPSSLLGAILETKRSVVELGGYLKGLQFTRASLSLS